MTLNSFHNISATKRYYKIRFKGRTIGSINSRIIKKIIEQKRFNESQLKNYSYIEITFMEYIRTKKPFITN